MTPIAGASPAGPSGPDPGDRADVVLVGAGGAGLAVLHALAHRDLTLGLPGPVRVVVVDPVPDGDAGARHRTWCFWATGDVTVAPAVHASWRHVHVSDATRDLVLDLDPYRYHLVRSEDLAALVADEVARAPRVQVERVVAAAEQVVSCRDHAHVEVAGRSIRADLVLDSRPARPTRSGSVFWWQHFRGWTLPAGSLPPQRHPGPVASLMDFRTEQPAAGLSFGYLLPLPDGRALAEYTEFSPERLDDEGYDTALRGYLDLLGVARDVVPDHVETGAIPMTDGAFARHVGSRVVRIGTAGGATRGSTGYTFAAMLRDGAAVAGLVAGGALGRRGPVRLPPSYPARHRWMDAVQLQALDAGRIDGPQFFTDLFDRRPAGQVLRFLDGTTDAGEDLGIMAASPTLPMTWTAMLDGVGRLRAGLGRRSPAAVPEVPAVPVPTSGHRLPR
ncbi:lycopene cyclase family protein [Aquipuribacter sp. MA13-6]|uniref:lycopene cyclase family protein n=1 Tax=unclassified Aquipuribacter TaxID=2635084 RepID=UPI003EEEB238